MDYSVYKISLDIHKPEAQEVLEMKLLDSKRRIQISLTENGKVYKITPDCKAMFSAEKSDGNKIYNQCEIVNNTIIYDVTQQTLACLGEVDCEVQLLGSDEAVITSPRFSIIVHDRVYNGEDIVDSEMETNVFPGLIAKSHSHDNKDTLDQFTRDDIGRLFFDNFPVRYADDGSVITDHYADDEGNYRIVIGVSVPDEEGVLHTEEIVIPLGNGSGSGLTPEQLADLEANTKARHEHLNKSLLDTLTEQWVNNLDSKISTNKTLAIAANKYVKTSNQETAVELDAAIHYIFGEVESLTLTLGVNNNLKRLRNEYSFTFISGETPTVLTLPSSVQWVNELTVEANKRYEISIVDNIGLWCAVDLAVTE